MKEIKATAPTREELYQEYKRVSEENERLRQELKFMESLQAETLEALKELENKTND